MYTNPTNKKYMVGGNDNWSDKISSSDYQFV